MLRDIIVSNNNQIVIDLPEDLVNQRLEIFIVPVNNDIYKEHEISNINEVQIA